MRILVGEKKDGGKRSIKTTTTVTTTSTSGRRPAQVSRSPTESTDTAKSPTGTHSGYNSGDEYNDECKAVVEPKYAELLYRRKHLVVLMVKPDGNCLFRAVAIQLHGDQEFHAEIRKRCLDYLEKEKSFFQQFVTEPFDQYVKRKKKEKTFGNHVEMQALMELYNRPVHIYVPGKFEPSHVFSSDRGSEGDRTPIRLLYVNKCHYHAVIDPENSTLGGLGMNGMTKCEGIHIDREILKEALRSSENETLENALVGDAVAMSEMEEGSADLLDHVKNLSLKEYYNK